MCRFFTPIRTVKSLGAISFLVPLSIMVSTFSTDDFKSGAISCGWFINSIVAMLIGYYIGSDRKCTLPHLAENIVVDPEQQIELSQIEGAGEELKIVVAPDFLPNLNR